MPTFDGDELVITLDSGVTTIDVELDLYSAWKDWVLLSDNAKYPFAFRTVGGDPLTPGLSAGSYFFLQNQVGWRIRPPEEDINIKVIGNLVGENSDEDVVIPTIGAFTTSVVGLQPITQGVDELINSINSLAAAIVAADLVVATGSTSTVVRTNATQITGFYDGLIIVAINSAGSVARSVLGYSNTNGAFTLDSALPFTPSSGDRFIVLGRVASAAASVDTNAVAIAVWARSILSPTVGSYGELVNKVDKRTAIIPALI